uniref:Uncharacterized protein n=1 Tax=Rhizophora mucronata TaxID=61149 RepID=A0A2P2QRG3_RHIMU
MFIPVIICSHISLPSLRLMPIEWIKR